MFIMYENECSPTLPCFELKIRFDRQQNKNLLEQGLQAPPIKGVGKKGGFSVKILGEGIGNGIFLP